MPKMKTRRSALKRVKVTGSGKLKIKRSNLRHILTKKSADRKRKLRRPDYVASCDVERLKRAIVYC